LGNIVNTLGKGVIDIVGIMGSKWDIEKFTGSNDFGLWKVKMQAVLTQQMCVEALKGEAVMPASLTQAEKREMIDKAKSAIVLCLRDKVLRDVAREVAAASMWAKLESLYMTKSLAHRQLLKQELYPFKMVESKSISEQLAEFNKILDDLANIVVNMEDEDKTLLLLCSLPKSFEHFKDTILYGKEGTTTLEEVQSALRTKELTKFKDLKVDEGGEGLNVARGRSEHRGKGKGKLRSKGFDKSKYRCFLYHKQGHFKKDCSDKGGNGSSSVQVVVASDEDGYESAGALVVTSWEPKKSWVLDSGCSYHMCPRKEYFETLTLKEGGVVRLGNSKACKVQGMGTVRLKMFDGREFLLKDVRFVPKLKRNLISISMFDSLGYCTRIEHEVCKISHGALITVKRSKMNGLYILDGYIVIGNASVASLVPHNNSALWHLRLGHVSEIGLVEVAKQGLLGKDKLDKLEFCEHRILGKQDRVKFGSGMHHFSRPFKYVHSDLWGPSKTLTHRGFLFSFHH